MTLREKASHAWLLYMNTQAFFWYCRWRHYHCAWIAEITGR